MQVANNASNESNFYLIGAYPIIKLTVQNCSAIQFILYITGGQAYEN